MVTNQATRTKRGKSPSRCSPYISIKSILPSLRISRGRVMVQPFDLGSNGIVVNPPGESDLTVDGYQRVGQTILIDGLDDIPILLPGLRLGQIEVLDLDRGAVVALQ